YNYAVNGVTMATLCSQANKAVTQGVESVTIQMGANDACKATEGAMTPVTSFRNQFQNAMNSVAAGLPNTGVFVASIPDLMRLWEIGKDDASARSLWAFGGICQSMLANPQSTAPADADRRARVQQRVIDYNAALASVCEQFANCRFDDNVVFESGFVLGDLAIDYFHPGVTGQALLATTSYAAGWDW
ncbi:MAG TPA: SGNH/GDSL hydrolase family protein, partial [Acidimicrobiia bacterium]|nr:SGNH/GDSL hydrolase family protein [Acidimicrobiia bacterium]